MAAEEEEKKFYKGDGGDEWIKALEPLGTDPERPDLTVVPWFDCGFYETFSER